jgi:hypothetical protein
MSLPHFPPVHMSEASLSHHYLTAPVTNCSVPHRSTALSAECLLSHFLLSHCFTVPHRPNIVTGSLSHCLAVPLSHCPIVSLSQCGSILLTHCVTRKISFGSSRKVKEELKFFPFPKKCSRVNSK